MKLLSEIPSLISTLQANKVKTSIDKKREEGEFITQLEYEENLREALNSLVENDNSPLFSFLGLSPSRSSSENFNRYIEDISSDIEIALSEINYLFSKIESHKAYYEKLNLDYENILLKLKREIESIKIESIHSSLYNKVISDSFLDSSSQMSSIDSQFKELFFDERTFSALPFSNAAEMDISLGRLISSRNKESVLTEASISIVSDKTSYSILLPELESPSFLFSEEEEESWSYPILSRTRKKNPLTLVMALDFPSRKEFNEIYITPNSEFPCFLERIEYETENGDILDMNIIPFSLTSSSSIQFPRVITKKVIFHFSQESSISLSLDLARINKENIQEQIVNNLKDPLAKKLIGEMTEESSVESFYLYNFSFNHLAFYLSNFKEDAFFISKPQRAFSPSRILLEEDSIIEKIKDPLTSIERDASFIEYSIYKKDYSKNGKLLKSGIFNILPFGTTETEEFLPFYRNRVISLRFLGHLSDGDASGIQLFRNGEPLILGVDWRFPDRSNVIDPSGSLLLPNLSSTRVEILHSSNQLASGIYSARYTPRYNIENTGVIEKGIRYDSGNSTVHPIELLGQEISYSDIFTRIIMRSPKTEGRYSPYIDYYRLNIKEEKNV